MTAYVVIGLDVHDPDGFQHYVQGASALLGRFGARTLVGDSAVTALEGDWRPPTLVIHEFPSREAVLQFWNSPEYQPLKRLRRHHSRVNIVVADNGTRAPRG